MGFTLWLKLLHKKGHLSPKNADLLTDTMARHIAWNDYADITR